MPWDDDSWRDGYDAWKLASPDDYYDADPGEDCCEHEDYDSDILTGRAICHRCGHAWWQTQEEIAADVERIRAYDEWTRQQERPWARFREWLRRLRVRVSMKIHPGDGIPF